MLGFLQDQWNTIRLRARYRRLVQEQLVSLTEADGPQPVADDPGDWMLLGGERGVSESERQDLRTQARRLVHEHPHARNVLRLLEIYVTGPGFQLNAARTDPNDGSETSQATDRVWQRFLRANQRHFSIREFARRVWRDGECFLRLFVDENQTSTVRFIDPEQIGEPPEHTGTQGIVTEPGDVETPLLYLVIDPIDGSLRFEIPADELLHTRRGVDSNEKRGVTWFAPLIEPLAQFDRWLDTELTARKLQASIVLWRKVQGGPSRATSVADASQTGTLYENGGTTRRERFRAGTILTTSQGTELEYLQPNTNFGDAVPLGRLLLLCTAAGSGLPEFMLTSDASNGNFASTMVAEGPAVKLFQAEQQFFAAELERLWEWVIRQAIARGELPEDTLDRVQPEWTFPQLVARDRNKDRLADVRLANAKILSRAEVARRDGTNPSTMRSEIADEE